MAARKTHNKSRVYSGAEKAEALVVIQSNNGNITRSSNQLGIARKTLETWVRGTQGISTVTPAMIETATDETVGKLSRNIDLYLEAAQDPEKIEKASLKDINLSLAIAIDKRNLLSGRATSITESRSSDRTRLTASIKQVILECRGQGIEIDEPEAVRLLKGQLDQADARLLDEILLTEENS